MNILDWFNLLISRKFKLRFIMLSNEHIDYLSEKSKHPHGSITIGTTIRTMISGEMHESKRACQKDTQ